MKTAYELAMERLNKSGPGTKVSAEQKKSLAELDSQYAAKIAAREIHIKSELAKAAAKGDPAEYEQWEQRWVAERKELQTELEEKKDKIRSKSK